MSSKQGALTDMDPHIRKEVSLDAKGEIKLQIFIVNQYRKCQSGSLLLGKIWRKSRNLHYFFCTPAFTTIVLSSFHFYKQSKASIVTSVLYCKK